MIQVPPIAQWMRTVPFLTDTTYPRDFVVVAREQGTSVELECLGAMTDAMFVPIGGTAYEVGFVDLDVSAGNGTCTDGAQLLQASAPIGVLVGGVDLAASYGYPGGLSFNRLWNPPLRSPD